jgi:hypothetical protein
MRYLVKLRYFFVLLISIELQVSAVQQSKLSDYKGIVPGRSLERDVTRILGQPDRVDRYDSHQAKEFVYLGKDNYIEEIRVGLRENVVNDIYILTKNLTIPEAIKRFGSDFRTVRYSFDDCLSDGDSAPLFEDPSGTLEFIEYRSRGLYLLIAEAPRRVKDIRYTREPPGSPRSRCDLEGRASPRPGDPNKRARHDK